MFNKTKQDKIKPSTEIVKDWRDAGHEIEVIGLRLDKARTALKSCKEGTWAYNYWNVTTQRLLNKWHLTIKLRDTGLKQIVGKEEDLERYDWWEPSEEVPGLNFGIAVFDDWFYQMGLQARLEVSWAKAQEQKLQKARQGLA